MTVDEAEARLRQLLSETDCARPHPSLVWEAFKRFAVEPGEAETVEVFFEAGDGSPGDGSPAYFDFVRGFRHYPAHGAACDEQITAHFTADPSVQLGLGGVIQAKHMADLPAFFREVEASPQFQAGLAFQEWCFEVRVDGS